MNNKWYIFVYEDIIILNFKRPKAKLKLLATYTCTISLMDLWLVPNLFEAMHWNKLESSRFDFRKNNFESFPLCVVSSLTLKSFPCYFLTKIKMVFFLGDVY